ncbi:AraC family transcriptional regulator [Jannaschia sp. LMIT008]|uniref:AraC family transcriptional regulator n=1 Tax=Jannaschia maritima TaxID=3032585 RepID=UPI00281138ED|nr:AraC family transcriptional regulator [Jannaschia sp. LMIT008]
MADPVHRIDLTHIPAAGWTRTGMTVTRAGRLTAGPGDAVRRPAYPGQDLLLCLSGRGTIDSGGRAQRVAQGDLAWIANDGPHGHRADEADPWTLAWCRIDGPELGAMRSALHPGAQTVTRLARPAGALAWFERLFALLRAPSPGVGTDLRLNRMVAELLDHLPQGWGDDCGRGMPKVLDPLLRAMRARPELAWSAGEMTAVTGLSEAQLRRLFARHLSLAPRAWLRRERITLAQRLIAEGNTPLKTVALRCGFCDVYHFSRAFRQETGLAPGAWRAGRV